MGQRNNHADKLVWLAPSLGYNGKLLYFEAIFSALDTAAYQLVIPVDKDFQVCTYPDLQLTPILSFFTLTLKRSVFSRDYSAVVKIPRPSSIAGLWKLQPTCLMVVEFSPLSIIGLIIARLQRRSCIMLIEGNPKYRGVVPAGFTTFAKRVFSRLATSFLTNNEEGLDYLCNDLKVSATRVMVAPYLTSWPPRSAPGQGHKGSGQTKLRRREDCVNVLFLNNVTERKGLMQLAEALNNISADMARKICVHVVGDGPCLPSVIKYLEANDLMQLVEFYGAIDYSVAHLYYQGCDIFVSPSLADYRSLCGFEALSFCLPLILSKFDGAAKELVDEGHNGWIIDPHDSVEFGNLLERLPLIVPALESMRRHNKLLARKYTPTAIAQNIHRAVLRA